MDRTWKLCFNTYCKHKFYREILARIKDKNILKKDSRGICLNHCLKPNILPTGCQSSTYSMPSLHRRRSPFAFAMCHFHTSRTRQRLHRTGKRGMQGYDKEDIETTRSLENTNWNLKSDPGLSTLYEQMEKEMERLEVAKQDPSQATKEEGSEASLTDKELEDLAALYSDSATQQIEIEDFTVEEITETVEPQWLPPVELKRGTKGVFDVEEIVEVLRSENARDICVIKFPESFRMADYLVIATGISARHCTAIASAVQWIYKRKKTSKDVTLKPDGKDSKDWIAFDLGNIFLHVFLPDARAKYDLETLWTCGEEFDDKSKEVDDPFALKQSDLDWLMQYDVNSSAQK